MANSNESLPDMSESLEAILGSAKPRGVQALIGPLIDRTLSQCYALLRQELERKVKREPLVYSQFRAECIMREFQTVATDIKASVAERVEARALELVQQEVRRVFDYALSEAQGTLTDPVWEEATQNRGPAVQQLSEPTPKPGKHYAPREKTLELPREDREEPHQPGGAPPAPPVAQLTTSTIPLVAPAKPAPGNGSGVAPEMEMSETRVVHPAPQPKAVPEKPSRASAEEVNEEEVYQGTVRLNVEGNSDIRCLVQFVEGLRQKPQLRLLQLVGNHKDGVSIWVGLREPLWLKKILLGMEHVSRVSTPLGKAPNGSERLLRVCLTKPLLP